MIRNHATIWDFFLVSVLWASLKVYNNKISSYPKCCLLLPFLPKNDEEFVVYLKMQILDFLNTIKHIEAE